MILPPAPVPSNYSDVSMAPILDTVDEAMLNSNTSLDDFHHYHEKFQP